MPFGQAHGQDILKRNVSNYRLRPLAVGTAHEGPVGTTRARRARPTRTRPAPDAHSARRLRGWAERQSRPLPEVRPLLEEPRLLALGGPPPVVTAGRGETHGLLPSPRRPLSPSSADVSQPSGEQVGRGSKMSLDHEMGRRPLGCF